MDHTRAKKKKYILYRIVRPIFYGLMLLLYRPKRINRELIPTDGSAVLAGNHKNAADPVLVDMCTKRVVHTLAKKSLHDGRFGWFFRGVGSIPVETGAKHNSGALNTAVEFLNDNTLINVSPEGTRNRTSALLLPFKAGAVVMAQRAGCPIIPYSITGDYRFRTKNLKIVFGDPIDVSGMSVEEGVDLLYHTVEKMIVENRSPI